jgi:acetylglutamate kinase
MDKLIAKANVLLEALPYIQRFAGKTVVIKYGGAAMVEPKLKAGFAQDVVLLNSLGLRPVIVHGGGPQIARALKKAGIESTFVRGLRVTSEDAMAVVETVLGRQVNKDIVALVQGHGGKAVGLSGRDGDLLQARKLRPRGPGGKTVDLGMVGRVHAVEPRSVAELVASGLIPVIAPIGVDSQGRSYNINADMAAAKVAAALSAAKLMILTDVAGIRGQSGHVQAQVSASQAKAQIRSGVIKEGMVPKVQCAVDAVASGVEQVHIIDGRVSHAVLLEIFTRKGVGTEVVLRSKKGLALSSRDNKLSAKAKAGRERK